MPATLAATIAEASAFISEAAATVGEVAGTISVAGSIGSIALSALEFGLTSLLNHPNENAGSQQFSVRQPIPNRRRYYGKNKAGGPFAFIRSINGSLFNVVMIASHEIEYLEHWIGDRLVTLDGSGNVVGPDSMVRHTGEDPVVYIIDPAPGTATQSAHAKMVTDLSGIWTTDHKLLGIANVMFFERSVQEKQFTHFYPGGSQPYRTVFNGDRAWNGNDSSNHLNDRSTWALGYDNAAWVIWDYLTHSDGMRLPLAAVQPALSDWQYAGTVSDQTVSLANGGTDKRYRLCGGYDFQVAPKDQLKLFLDACDGMLSMRGDGALTLKVGEWTPPTVTIDDSHIRSFSLPRGLGPLRMANEIDATFTDSNNDYQPVQAQPWRDEDDISARGTVLNKQLDLTFCPTHNQARRMMKIASYRANPDRTGTITTDLYGLNALGERRIHVTIARRNIDMDMDVTSFKIDLDTMSCIIGVATAAGADAYEFDAATEEGTVPAPGLDGTDGDIEEPQNVVCSSSSGTITVTCDPPTDREDLQFNAEYAVHGGDTWTAIPISDSAYTGTSGVVAAGSYDVRAWFSAPGGAASEYVTVTGVIVSANRGSKKSLTFNGVTTTNPVTVLVTDGTIYLHNTSSGDVHFKLPVSPVDEQFVQIVYASDTGGPFRVILYASDGTTELDEASQIGNSTKKWIYDAPSTTWNFF